MASLSYWICFIILVVSNFISLVLSIALDTFCQVGVSIKNFIKSLIKYYMNYFADLNRKYNELKFYPMISNTKNQNYSKKRNKNHKGTCKFCKTRSHSTKKCFQYSQENIEKKNWCLLCRSPLHVLTNCTRYDPHLSLDLKGCKKCKNRGYLAFHNTDHCEYVSPFFILHMRHKFPQEHKYQQS